MGHVVNFSPVPSSAIEAQLLDVPAPVVSVRDVEDEVEACRGAVVAVADFTEERRLTIGHATALASTCRLVTIPATATGSVDLIALRDVGIPVATAAGLNAVPVAEWAVWATIGALRHLGEQELAIREGGWERFGSRYEVAAKRVLIVGMGGIGQAVAQRLGPFGADLHYWTRSRRPESLEQALGITYDNLDAGLRSADVVVLAVALTSETRHLVSTRRLKSMKPSAVVVNAARAEVVDQAAVAAALDQGLLHGYATDVFDVEPPSADDPMLSAATILTPHIAGVTVESVGRILDHTIENVNRVLRGDEPVGLLSS